MKRFEDTDIRNIYCVGRNYKLHAEELGNAIPKQPMIFTKPTHDWHVIGEQQQVALPMDRGALHYEAEVVFYVGQRYEAGMKAEELLKAMALGIDLTLRDVQQVCKEKGHPWLSAKGFRRSALITAFTEQIDWKTVENTPFRMLKNGQEVQSGRLSETIFSVQQIVDFIGAHFGLGQGDVIYTGTPAGVGEVSEGDEFELQWNGERWGQFKAARA
ncbi:fumarylacetoacetate hydrolase family protein [Marinicrinis lubricantis]|uniref:Fumarylacetoacetate hydrolase family protein n=1 Tax=Marinicrinis lubricantis TaxID=2086470 RepID=A0ABW1IT60_9BACL